MSLISPFEIAEHYSMHCWSDAACHDQNSRNGIVAGSLASLGQPAWYEYIPLWPSERERDICAPAPPWCAYTAVPFYKIKECMPLSEEERIMCQQREFGPAMTPEMRERALEEGAKSEKAYLELLKREEPEKAKAFEDVEKLRKCIDSGQSAFWCEYGNYVMWGGFGILAFLMISRR